MGGGSPGREKPASRALTVVTRARSSRSCGAQPFGQRRRPGSAPGRGAGCAGRRRGPGPRPAARVRGRRQAHRGGAGLARAAGRPEVRRWRPAPNSPPRRPRRPRRLARQRGRPGRWPPSGPPGCRPRRVRRCRRGRRSSSSTGQKSSSVNSKLPWRPAHHLEHDVGEVLGQQLGDLAIGDQRPDRAGASPASAGAARRCWSGQGDSRSPGERSPARISSSPSRGAPVSVALMRCPSRNPSTASLGGWRIRQGAGPPADVDELDDIDGANVLEAAFEAHRLSSPEGTTETARRWRWEGVGGSVTPPVAGRPGGAVGAGAGQRQAHREGGALARLGAQTVIIPPRASTTCRVMNSPRPNPP